MLLCAVVLAVSAGSVVAAEFSAAPEEREPHTVRLEDGSELWPYTSRSTAFDERTLAINLVVYGNPDAAEAVLRESRVAEWEDVEDDEEDIAPAEEREPGANETTIAWGSADGAIRYVYAEGRWMTESYQLRDGDYLGARHHVRAYEDPTGGDWTAMQVHLEHWDWFHLRHTVHSTEESQLYVEEQFIDKWYVESLQRHRFDNEDGGDSNGWVTIIDLRGGSTPLVSVLVLFGSFRARRREWSAVSEWTDDSGVRRSLRSLSVVLALVAVYAAVRFGGIGIERLFPGVPPKLIAAVLYPVLVFGMPVAAYMAARALDATLAFTAGAIGFTVATFMDYTYLGVTTLPLNTFVHRATLAVALGFIAAGASRSARRPDVEFGYVRTGTLLWAAALSLPVLQFL